MPLLRKWNYRGAVLGIWHVTETQEELKNLLTDIPYIEEELEVYKSDSRRMEYLAVRALLKDMTGHCCRILHMPSGKPYLEDGDMKISISHTKGYVAVGLHPHSELGIDIEYFSERVKKVSSRFIRDDEKEYILPVCTNENHHEREVIYKLLLVWSGKETLYKVIDLPEVDFREHMRIYPFCLPLNDGDTGRMESHEYRSELQSRLTIEFILHDDFVFTYCVAE